VFCSFLALILRKELDQRLNRSGFSFEWADIRQDLKALQEIQIKEAINTLLSVPNAKEIAGKYSRQSA